MWLLYQGIPHLPDLTHPQELMQFGSQVMRLWLVLLVLVGLLGGILALLNFSQGSKENPPWLHAWLSRYGRWLQGLQHATLILFLLVVGFFLCSTLANRYHHWEQAQVQDVAASVAGERLEQYAPRLRYMVEQTYTGSRYVDGEYVEVERTRQDARYLALPASQIEVILDQTTDPASDRLIYQTDYRAEYKITNTLDRQEQFFFDARPPYGYRLLQDYQVTQIQPNQQRLEPVNPNEYSYPIQLDAGESKTLQVTYQAQGASRWVYNSQNQLLANFRLSILANFPRADFASGIVPTQMQPEGEGTRFIWEFSNNVSVENPFGVFTATSNVENTGIIPLLLILSPGVFLWWLLLLYLSVPLQLRDVTVAAGIFFAFLLSLTYGSRLMPAEVAWSLLSPLFLFLVWGLGNQQRTSLAIFIATISGAILPVLGLLVPYRGLTLSIAGVLSVTWLAVRLWYGWEPSLRKS